MASSLTYRGRPVSPEDIIFIRELIKANPDKSRWKLSRLLCEEWNWVQPNGALRDMVCRGLMLELHRKGHIELPPIKRKMPNPLANRSKPAHVEIEQTPQSGPLARLQPLEFRQIRRTSLEPVCNGLIEEHHYLGYTHPVGEHLKYVILSKDQIIACMTWSSAPRHLGPRDRFIGWPVEARKQNIRFVAYNSRYLILPWVRVPHLASHILGRMARILPNDWEQVYGHPVYFLESFVEPQRFRGTCYYAANWIFLGKTTGRGKNDQTHRPNRPLKDVLGHPLCKQFREILSYVD